MNKKITSLRLQKEQQSIQNDPIPQAIIVKKSFLLYHFCLLALEEDFAGGFYHGVLQLPQDYPFSPPKITFLTENGRFQVDKYICTTFTHYHKQTWSSSWNIKTIITALISFMYSNQKGIGGIFYSSGRRKALAKKSLRSNLSNPQFIELFGKHLIQRKIISQQQFISLRADKFNADQPLKQPLCEQINQNRVESFSRESEKEVKANVYLGSLNQEGAQESKNFQSYQLTNTVLSKEEKAQNLGPKPISSTHYKQPRSN